MDQENDFDKWNNAKKQTESIIPIIKIREGEIRWSRFGKNIGNETLGKGEYFKRPVLILKKFSGDVFLAIPITTKVHKGNWYYSIFYEGSEKSLILNQSRVMDRKRLEEKIVEVSSRELRLIKQVYCKLIMD